jgi:hypothetical protein
MIEIGAKTVFLHLCTKNKQNMGQDVQMGASKRCGFFGIGKALGLGGACPSQGLQKPWQLCWGNSTKSYTDQALVSKSKLAKMFCMNVPVARVGRIDLAPICSSLRALYKCS